MPPYHIGIKMHDLQPVGYPIPFVMATLNLLEWKGCWSGWWSMGWGLSYTGFVSWMKFLRYIHITFFQLNLSNFMWFLLLVSQFLCVCECVFSHNISVLIFRFCDFFGRGCWNLKLSHFISELFLLIIFHFSTFVCLFVISTFNS